VNVSDPTPDPIRPARRRRAKGEGYDTVRPCLGGPNGSSASAAYRDGPNPRSQYRASRGLRAHERWVVPSELGEGSGSSCSHPSFAKRPSVKRWRGEEHDLIQAPGASHLSPLGVAAPAPGADQARELRKGLRCESGNDFGKLAAASNPSCKHAVPLPVELGLAQGSVSRSPAQMS